MQEGIFAGLWAKGGPNGGFGNYLLRFGHFHWRLGCLMVNEDGQCFFLTHICVSTQIS